MEGKTFTIGSLTVIIKKGDITKATTDGIVNSSNDRLDLQRGRVSQAILHAGGPEIQDECRQIGRTTNGLAVTGAGRLPCRHIFHVSLPGSDDWNDIIFRTLQEAEVRRLRTMAFPALGTGQMSRRSDDSASVLLAAITRFASNSRNQHLQEIHILLFEQTVVDGYERVFQAGLQTAEAVAGVPAEDEAEEHVDRTAVSWLQLRAFIREMDLNKPIDDTQRKSKKSLGDAVLNYRRNLIDTQTIEFNAPGEKAAMSCLTDEDFKKLGDLQSEFDVNIEVDDESGDQVIRVTGAPDKVPAAMRHISNILLEAGRAQQRQEKADLMFTQVQWKYEDEHGTFVNYAPLTNMDIESASREKKAEVKFDRDGESRTIVFANMKEKCRTTVRKVQRVEPSGITPLPDTWEAMPASSRFRSYTLDARTEEYQRVERKFRACGATNKIIKIERIQNEHLFMEYGLRKMIMDGMNPGHDNERHVFHGTRAESLDNISSDGFNRSYSGKNAARLGKGVYFATTATYSAKDRFSVPDKDGHKYVFLCRVLTGRFAKGCHTYVEPPINDSGVRYDSVVDRLGSPEIFVVFRDAQAYPDYLITFKAE